LTVSDDSIAQCVRELRDRLGDNDHSLIKTVSRRGYLLNAVVTTEMPDQIAVTRSAPLRQVGIRQRIVTALAHIPELWRLVFRKDTRLDVRLAVTAGAAVVLGRTRYPSVGPGGPGLRSRTPQRRHAWRGGDCATSRL